MKHEEFKIGETFYFYDHLYKCTDKGTRAIIAIQIGPIEVSFEVLGSIKKTTIAAAEAMAKKWFDGPPYAVPEIILNENDIEVCHNKIPEIEMW